MKLIKRQKVSSSLTDFNANLSVVGTFQIMEDAVTEFMGELKIDGLTAKKVYNAVWVFVKNKTEFLKNIEWNNEYVIICFISKISYTTINIDVAIKNAADDLCVYSRTELCALDMDSGRIRKVSTVGVDDSFQTELPLADVSFTKIETNDLPVCEQVKVRFTNIDYAVHTNNKEYERFMLKNYSVREMADNPICEMAIDYVNQSHEGDLLTIRKGSCGNEDIVEIKCEDKSIVRCKISRSVK